MQDLLICVATPGEGQRLIAAGLDVLVTGMGPVNAAHALTKRLCEAAASAPVRRVISCGIGGAFGDVGPVAFASTEQFGDLGADSPDGFVDLGCSAEMPLDLTPDEGGVKFVTVSLCTGTDERAAELIARTGAAVESMEGAAVVQVAHSMGCLVGEVRGISNRAGVRERSTWRIPEAIKAAEEALLAWLA
jgi:futalosine hydrolase